MNSDERISILLVEDDVIDREHISRVLSSSFRVSLQTARCLHDGIQHLRQSHFDVVVFDLGLPDSYGLDTVKRMVEEFPNTPLIVLTGLANESTAREATALGVCDYLVKGRASANDITASVTAATLARPKSAVR